LPTWQRMQVLAEPLGEKDPAGQGAAWVEEATEAVAAMAVAPGTPCCASALARASVKVRARTRAVRPATLALEAGREVTLASTAKLRVGAPCSWRRLRLYTTEPTGVASVIEVMVTAHAGQMDATVAARAGRAGRVQGHPRGRGGVGHFH
jgi:hypothetical protein